MKNKKKFIVFFFLLCILLSVNVYAARGTGGGDSGGGESGAGTSSYGSWGSAYQGGNSGGTNAAHGGWTAGSTGDYYGVAGTSTVEIHSHGDMPAMGPGMNLMPDGSPVVPPTGGAVCPSYWVDVYAPDYTVAEVNELVVKKGQQALISVNVQNRGRKDGTTDVYVKIGDQEIEMTDVTIPAYGNHALSFGYYTPTAAGEEDIEVFVNPDHAPSEAPYSYECSGSEDCDEEGHCNGCEYSCSTHYSSDKEEYDYDNNSWSGVMNITKQPPVVNPDDPLPSPPIRPIPYIQDLPPIEISPTGGTGTGGPGAGINVPGLPGGGVNWPVGGGDPYLAPDGTIQTIGNNYTQNEWVDAEPTGSDVKYKAKLSMDVKVMDVDKPCTKLKSGYGFSLKVTCKITTDYPIDERIEAPRKVLLYVPDWGDYDHAIELKRTDGTNPNAKITTWELPVNDRSGIGARKWYVPEWWSDGMDYNFLIASKGTYTPGGELTSAYKHTIQIDSNMYTDDYSVN